MFSKVQQRYVVVTMMFVSMAATFALRISFPIVLTDMVYIPNANITASSAKLPEGEMICPMKHNFINGSDENRATPSSLTRKERYQWSQELQGIILSSFYWGTIFSELPSSVLAHKIGVKVVLLASIALSTLITALTPLAVELGGAYGLIATRICLGFVQGPTFPCLAAFVTPWFPIEQRGRLCSIGYIGISAGGVFATYVSGMLVYYTGRWDVVFYFFAAVTAIWWILFALLCYEQPKNHPFISDAERTMLQSKLENFERERKNVPPIPWKGILSNPPVITLVFSTALYSWSFYIVNTDLPKYLNDVLHVSIEKNSVYSSLPRVVSILVSFGSGWLGDWLHASRGVSVTHIRKIFVSLTAIVPATFLIAASYAGCDEILSVIFFTISIGGHGFNSAGAAINLFDLAPNYVSPINGIINSVANIVGISAPYIAGVLTPNALLSEWRFVFWLTFSLHMTEAVIYNIWGSGKVQKWNSG